MAWIEAAVIALSALILLPGSSFYFDITPKLVVLLAGTGLLLLLLFFREPRTAGSGQRPFQTRWFSLLLLVYGLSLGLSTIFSVRPELSIFGSTWRRLGSAIEVVVLFFAWLVYRTCAGRADRVRTILRAIVLAGAISAVYGIAQFAGWDPLLPAAGYHVGEGIWTIVRPPGTLGYASYFATWLLFVTFLSLADYRMEENRAWRRLALVAASLAVVAMVLTGTRAAILALAAGGVVWALFKGVRVTRQRMAVAGVALAALAALYFSPPGQQLRSRTRWFVEDPWGGARIDLWRDSLSMSARRLPAGFGPEVFTSQFPRYESAALARAYPDFAHESPHNIFLDALVSQGIPGLLALLLLCADGLRRAWRLRAAPFAAALAAALVSQQFTAFTMPTALVFFTTLGLLAALEEKPGESPPAKPRRTVLTAAPPAAAGCVLLYLSFRLLAADHALALAQQALDQENLQAAANAYRSYEYWRLPGGSADLWYSRRLLNVALNSKNPLARTGAMLQAEGAARKAAARAEDPFNAEYNLAVIYGLHNNGTRAAGCLRAAIAANPQWYKPHWTLAQVLRTQGQIAEARAQAEMAAQLDGGKHAEVARTLAEIRAQFSKVQFPQLQR